MRVLIAVCALLLPLLAGATVQDDVFRAVQACTAKATSMEQYRNCMIKPTPRKCRQPLRGRMTDMRSMALRRAWMTCISTCEGASLISRTFGECSTPSDPNK